VIAKIKARVKTLFLSGLLFIIPAGFTLFVLTFLVNKLDLLFTPLLDRIFRYFGFPHFIGAPLPGLGFLLGLATIFLVGLLTRNFIGKKFVVLGEKIVEKIPFVSSLYNGAKQVIEAVASSKTGAFRRVVLLEYPRRGTYCIGLITCEDRGEIQEKTNQDVLNVFIPTTPNPTSGYLLFVPRDQLIYLDMSVEQGIKMVISGGIVAPNNSPDPQNREISESPAPLPDGQ